MLFVANHASHVDTPALLRSLPGAWRRRTAVAAAADYFYADRRLAMAVSLAFGTVPLERRGDDATMSLINGLLARRWNLVIFAEGTRSRDGHVGVLRPGAAVLAARHELPIVPVHIAGTHAAMPTGSRWMVRPHQGFRHDLTVSFGPAIEVGRRDDRFETIERVRLFMAQCGADTTQDPKLVARRVHPRVDVRSTRQTNP